MDKCRTIMEQAKIPKYLWGFSIMIVVHLTNQLPSRSLQLRSPIEILERVFPIVKLRTGLTPRVFGFISYIHSHSLPRDKLWAKTLKCVFIGYSNTHKGYKCYHPRTRKCFISKDVTFDERNFYYLLSIDPRGDQNSIKGNIPTTLPFPNLPKESEDREVPQSQEDQAVTEQPNLEECPSVITLPKYYVRR